jgi:transposase
MGMKAYSVDLRERVVRSWQSGRAQTWIARELGISLGSVKRYLKLYQRTGSLKPRQQEREKPMIGQTELVDLQMQVDSHQDATLDEHIEYEYWVASHGLMG